MDEPISVPELVANPPGRGIRFAGRFVSGVRSVSNQIEPYTSWWNEQNQIAVRSDGPLWVAIGDSTALGIGASEPANSYVGIAAAELGLRVVNLAMSGARVRDGLDRQLPILDDLMDKGIEVACVTMCLGSNDVFWRSSSKTDTDLRADLTEAIDRLPAGSAVTPAAGASERAKLANRAIRSAAARRGFPVMEVWGRGDEPPSERLASDRFHPNDLGYARMAEAVVETLVATLGS